MTWGWEYVKMKSLQVGQAVALRAWRGVRKVRAPQGTVLGNTQAGQPDGEGPQKQTARLVGWYVGS